MRVLVSWLRELVEVPVSIEELAEALTLRGFEVGAVETQPPNEDGSLDAVLDLEITTNRPDCLSVIGIAREVSTLYKTDLRPPSIFTLPGTDSTPLLTVTVDDPHLCPRYVGAVASVSIGPSPPWIARRLEASDIRPVNNVVDITNYVMLETGHPMHAFDFDKLSKPEIRVCSGNIGGTIKTIDGVERRLQPEMLTIADPEQACAVAGIMGGADSEVTETTQTVVLEAAYFNPTNIRRTGKSLGLTTDASYRFERGADVAAPPTAMNRALELLITTKAGTPQGPIVDHFPSPPTPIVVRLRHHRIGYLLGQQIDENFIAPTLNRLGFKVRLEPDSDTTAWQVQVPSFRVDVKREEDLIEEIARHHGYDRLPTTFPALTRPPSLPAPWRARDGLVRRLLTGCGFSEAITYAFIERASAQSVSEDSENIVALQNPLSEKASVLRPSLIPGLLDSLIHNRRRERQDIRLFEIGSRFRRNNGESHALAIAMTGSATSKHWSSPDRKSDFYDIVGVVTRLCEGFGVQIALEQTRVGHLVPGQTASISLLPTHENRTPIGEIGQLCPEFATRRGLTGSDPVFVAELDLRPLSLDKFDRLQANPVPRYPSMSRDLSVEVDNSLPAADVRGTILASAGSTLVQVKEIDLYQGEEIATGAVSLSYRLTFRAPDRTLTDAEVQSSIDAVLRALAEIHRAKQR